MTEEETLNAAAVQLYAQISDSDQRAMDDLREYQQTADYANAFPGAPLGQLLSCEPYHDTGAAATLAPGFKYLNSLRMHYVLDTHGNAMELPASPDI
tara:strand:+ start:194 stop:484 length:291 start_codon:yes stop_codon:yes gene_type:complete